MIYKVLPSVDRWFDFLTSGGSDNRGAFSDAQGVSEGVNSRSRLARFDRRISVFTLFLR